jgi:outer membrane protein OmpA-like peptidoglycan-associated protein
MQIMTKRQGALMLLATLAVPVSGSLSAQQQDTAQPVITVTGAQMPAGPEIKGIISARNDEKIKITAADGTVTIISVNDNTRINRGKYNAESLLNGLPVTVKTLQSADGLVAGQITFRNKDLKTANMIRSGTAQQFDEQTAATEALRGRMGDIDKYNIKSTTNVYFDTGRAVISATAKAELCATATQAEAMNNALMLVVGYTDSVGSDELNQALSEKRAGSVINYLQQACRWKPYRMLTPTGMAEADPLASNDTAEGKAQNRRVSVNILVSKGLDGM